MRQIASKLYLTIFWSLVAACAVGAILFVSEPDSAREPLLHALFLPLFFLPVLLLILVRRWWLWLVRDEAQRSSGARRPPASENWSPEVEEAGTKTSAWVEEKLRQAKKS